MCAEEVMCGLAVYLPGNSEEREKLHSVKKFVDRGIEIDYGGRTGEDHVVDFVSKLRRQR